MTETLPAPEVEGCEFDTSLDPHLPAMSLRWKPGAGGERCWELPGGVTVRGPAPRRFGVGVLRVALDDYTVRLVWDRTGFVWPALGRAQLLASALAPLLSVLGTDLGYILDQPVAEAGTALRTA
jgi:hypothetical protein